MGELKPRFERDVASWVFRSENSPIAILSLQYLDSTQCKYKPSRLVQICVVHYLVTRDCNLRCTWCHGLTPVRRARTLTAIPVTAWSQTIFSKPSTLLYWQDCQWKVGSDCVLWKIKLWWFNFSGILNSIASGLVREVTNEAAENSSGCYLKTK